MPIEPLAQHIDPDEEGATRWVKCPSCKTWVSCPLGKPGRCPTCQRNGL